MVWLIQNGLGTIIHVQHNAIKTILADRENINDAPATHLYAAVLKGRRARLASGPRFQSITAGTSSETITGESGLAASSAARTV